MTEKEAMIKAKLLCSKLSKKWKPLVWHNLYWCYAASLDGISVYEHNDHTYSAFYMPDSIVVGHSDNSPQEAITNLKNQYKQCFLNRQKHWQALSEIQI